MNEFVTWEFLATFAGATMITALITQAIKNKLNKIPTQLMSYIIAVVVLLLANFFTVGLTVSSAILLLFNALGVSLASNGGYQAVTKIADTRKKH